MFNLFKKKKKPDASFEEPLSPEADKFLAEACAEYEGKRDALLTGEWRLTSCEDWGFDVDTGIVTVKFADGSQWQADGQFLGSYSLDDQTFQWAWDSPDMGELSRATVFWSKRQVSVLGYVTSSLVVVAFHCLVLSL